MYNAAICYLCLYITSVSNYLILQKTAIENRFDRATGGDYY